MGSRALRGGRGPVARPGKQRKVVIDGSTLKNKIVRIKYSCGYFDNAI